MNKNYFKTLYKTLINATSYENISVKYYTLNTNLSKWQILYLIYTKTQNKRSMLCVLFCLVLMLG